VPPPKRGLRSLVATRFRKAVLAVVLLLLAGATTAIQQWIRHAGESATKSVLPQLGGAPSTIRVARLGTFDSGTLPFPYCVVPKTRLPSPFAIDAAARERLFAPPSLDADWATKQGGIPGSPGSSDSSYAGRRRASARECDRPEVVARKPAVMGWYSRRARAESSPCGPQR